MTLAAGVEISPRFPYTAAQWFGSYGVFAAATNAVQSAALRQFKSQLGSTVMPELVWSEIGSILRLSARELQVVREVFADHKEEAIAFDLGISPHTVNTYFQRLYSKLGVSSRTQLILCVMATYLALVTDQAYGCTNELRTSGVQR